MELNLIKLKIETALIGIKEPIQVLQSLINHFYKYPKKLGTLF
jgi:hypothetical protein